MSDEILTRTPPSADVRVAYGSDPNQFLDLRLPASAGPHPLVINIHGGFWRSKYDLAHAGHLCAALTAKHVATANLEYRRVGNPGGGWPGTFDDLRAALRFLQQSNSRYKLDPRRVLVMGHSAGGQLALALASREPAIRSAASLAGVLNLRRAFDLHLSHDAVVEFLGGTPSSVPDHYHEADPMQLAVPKSISQLIVHGAADDVVPVEFSRTYVDSMKKSGEEVTLLEIPGADHFDLIDPRSAAWSRIEPMLLHMLA